MTLENKFQNKVPAYDASFLKFNFYEHMRSLGKKISAPIVIFDDKMTKFDVYGDKVRIFSQLEYNHKEFPLQEFDAKYVRAVYDVMVNNSKWVNPSVDNFERKFIENKKFGIEIYFTEDVVFLQKPTNSCFTLAYNLPDTKYNYFTGARLILDKDGNKVYDRSVDDTDYDRFERCRDEEYLDWVLENDLF